MEEKIIIKIEPIEVKTEDADDIESNDSNENECQVSSIFIKNEVGATNFSTVTTDVNAGIIKTEIKEISCTATDSNVQPVYIYDVKVEEYSQDVEDNADHGQIKNEYSHIENGSSHDIDQEQQSSSAYEHPLELQYGNTENGSGHDFDQEQLSSSPYEHPLELQYGNTEENFNTEQTPSYSEIIKNITESKSVTCPICKEAFPGLNGFKKHIKTSHPEKLTCFQCNRMFASNSHLQSHNKAMHSGDIPCPTCGKMYANKTKLGRHKLKKHGGKDESFACEKCQKSFRQKYNLTRHMMLMHPLNAINCNQCSNTFKNEKLLRKHVIWDHPKANTLFKCYVCNKLLPSKEAYNKHLEDSHQWFSWGQCDICNKICKNKKSMAQHMKMKHNATQPKNPGKHACDICGKKFRTNTSVYWHKKQYHSDELKDNVCSVCSKKCLDNVALRCHLETVHSLEVATCDLCKKSFKSDLYLRRHTREVHKDKKPPKKTKRKDLTLPCADCGEIFTTRQLLSDHVTSKHMKGYVCCKFCNKYYATKKTLGDHTRRMHGDMKKAQPCNLCGKILNSSLSRHMKKMHKDEQSDAASPIFVEVPPMEIPIQ